MEFNHVPILLNECIENLKIHPNGIYVDGTLGGAGHGVAICKNLTIQGHFIGIDQDENAIKAAQKRLMGFPPKISVIRDNFRNIKSILEKLKIEHIDGMFLDLGVSSHQLDEPLRGFSYQNDAPLDMRMDNRKTFTAKDIVNHYSKQELTKIIKTYGEEKWAARISQFIVEYRKNKEINTTGELVDIIKKAIPAKARRNGPHPAKRTFQAIRIEVNNELDILKDSIEDIVDCLNPEGRICIISFHSLEDRIVKKTFQKLENPCECPPEFPQCVCNKKPKIKIITKRPIIPTELELKNNPRARSAKLRVAQKIGSK
ncbi:16S rRNA (cytosine(1402)-N(4))-methyltransferase RsmH [Garciella nitratireducens]|uniref:Ribosomal RNA small subunit methyltransferase H n=1 Tax=Garciella nitratireducens DSM 15102 TaxID=1121911 RepID=A0A1T4JT76_9FIRM|nr:16S rRNA (cytosine(1402)-N(4))-methyltransferase RsmH [Garciella nitratireducens]RBP45549.1 16S rRNA (cytosine1402-N4)-methyltransferase [Garciella nitratireducens]SJZ33341.1 16S rRNA (cytosine1402-N4)-methyltransferase [Garciella nitratireducens DSM 15102]